MRSEWNGFIGGKWEKFVDVRDFIQKNYTPFFPLRTYSEHKRFMGTGYGLN